MYDILLRAGCFIGIILMGAILRKVGFFKEEDFLVLSKIVIKITLTCAIIVNFAGKEITFSMLSLTALGFGFGVTLILLGILLNKKRDRDGQAFAIVNQAGCNIGNFALPFAQSFLGSTGVIAVSLFDIGNAFISLGGSFSIAALWKDKSSSFSAKPVLKAMGKSVPLMAYVTLTILGLLRIHIPKPILEYAGIAANANAFLAMLMIGVGFKISGGKGMRGDIVRILLTRYIAGIVLALICWFFLPFALPIRQALVIVALAPVPSAAPGFTAELKMDYGLASAINSISIVISIVLITASLLLIV